MYLKHLSISGFRGVGSHLDLPLDHRTIIYGPNGSGKSSALQAIAWTIYGKLPFLTGTVFTREDALVNDFLDETRAEVTLTLSGDVTMTRTRNKQRSTSRGKDPLTLSPASDDPQASVEQLIGLGLEEFFAAVFLHQETIRDFITTTPEKRSTTIDRMLGTYLLRTLVKVIDPSVPEKAIEDARGAIGQLDRQLAQASIISREVIQKRKEEHGDPAKLPGQLEDIHKDLVSATMKLGLPAPKVTLISLESGLAAVRQAQLNTVSALENQVGQLNALRERYEQAAITGWQTVHRRREQYGDPANLPNLLGEIQQDLISVAEELDIATAQANIAELGKSLADARRAQPSIMGQLEKRIGQLEILKERYEHISQQIIEDVSIPSELETRRAQIQAQINALNKEIIPALTRQASERQATERELAELRHQVQALPGLHDEIEQMQKELESLEAAGKRGTLYNQILTSGLDYLEQVQPENCPLCKQKIPELQALLDILLQETPEDVERMRREYKALQVLVDQKRGQASQLEQKQKQIREQETRLAGFADDLELQIKDKQRENETRASELTAVQAEIAQIEGRIKLASEHRRRLDAIAGEIENALGESPGEDVAGAIDQAIRTARAQVAKIQKLNLQPIADKLDRAKQLDEIQKDEIHLREFESSYQTADREKARLNYQIQRLTDLRNALQDIAETTKRHQQAIVTGVLNELDIHRYYQQLDPHPAYRQLQIEPELTGRGTYHYWIKALTDDRSRGTYVQTRFSTAQANCAAIAIFLSVNQHLSKRLETIILDDPSQSMDPEHKKRLALTLAAIPRQVIVATEDPQMFELLVDAFEVPTIHKLDSWTVDGTCLVG
jgi:DNA repair exonuclease SbcCD ATPase subunit